MTTKSSRNSLSELGTIALADGAKIIKNRYSTKKLMRMYGLTSPEVDELRGLCKKDPSVSIRKSKYTYNPASKEYTVAIPGEGLLTVSKRTHDDILEAYSDNVATPNTVSELARVYGMTKRTLIKYLRAFGITHSSLPVSDETLGESEENLEEIAEENLQRLTNTYTAILDRKRTRLVEDAASKWFNWEKFAGETLQRVINNSKPPFSPDSVKLAINHTNIKPSFICVYGLTDFHWGAYCPADLGDAYNREIASERVKDSLAHGIDSVLCYGMPDKFIVPVGSDWFHVDTVGHTTTKGTPQDVDGVWEDIYISGCMLAVSIVNSLTAVAPVELVLMPGNHDRQGSLTLLMFLRAWFKDDPMVTTSLSTSPRQYLVYGNNLLGFIHGDEVDIKTAARLMAIEAQKSWGEAKHKTVFLGNYHHERIIDDHGVRLIQLPSPKGIDRWHGLKGYIGSKKDICFYLLDKQSGLSACIYSLTDMEVAEDLPSVRKC